MLRDREDLCVEAGTRCCIFQAMANTLQPCKRFLIEWKMNSQIAINKSVVERRLENCSVWIWMHEMSGNTREEHKFPDT